GKTAAELIGTSFLDLLPPAARGAARRHVESLQANPRTVVYEHEVALPDGAIGWQAWIDQALCDGQGNVVEFQAIGLDITERKQADQDLQRLTLQLLEAQDEERRRIAHDLHDGAAQDLLALAMSLREIREVLPTENGTVQRLLTESQSLAERARQELRTLCY